MTKTDLWPLREMLRCQAGSCFGMEPVLWIEAVLQCLTVGRFCQDYMLGV